MVPGVCIGARVGVALGISNPSISTTCAGPLAILDTLIPKHLMMPWFL